MVWSPSFECHVRPDGEHEYRIGHPLVDQFLEFVVGRARPNTVRAYAHDLSESPWVRWRLELLVSKHR